eukprot:gene10626-12302_t
MARPSLFILIATLLHVGLSWAADNTYDTAYAFLHGGKKSRLAFDYPLMSQALRSHRFEVSSLSAGIGITCVGTVTLRAITNRHVQLDLASGDPDHKSIVLWSRVTFSGVKPNVARVKWVVSKHDNLKNPVAEGHFITHEGRDYTVKLIADGLKSKVPYFYGFSIENATSPVGKFKLPAAPGAPQTKLTYAVVSCSNWGFGYFNAYDAMSKVEDLDFWVHVGDYIYEYAAGDYPSAAQSVRNSSMLKPQNKLYKLDDYRQRYALYHEDPASQALHAAAPLVAVWDDHELADNAYVNGSSEHNNTQDGAWSVRVAAAVRAFHEWLPTRYLIDDGSYVKIWRSFTFGDLATLAVIETRITARTDSNHQLNSPMPHLPIWSAFSDLAALNALRTKYNTYRNQTNLTIIGNGEQMDWLKQTVAADTTWQLLGQGCVMLEQYGSDFAKAVDMQSDPAVKAIWAAQYANLTGGIANATITGMNGQTISAALVQSTARLLQAMGEFTINYNFDSWAGYQVNKRELLTTLSAAKNVIIYGGDSHNSWAGVESLDGKPVAAEFNSPAITSPGFESYFGWVPKGLMEAAMGFMLATLTHAKHHMEYVYVSTIKSMNYTAKCDYAVDTMAGAPGSWVKSACVC